MIIRKKDIQNKKTQKSQETKSSSKGNVIKKEDLVLNKKKVDQEPVIKQETKTNIPKQKIEPVEDEKFEKIDISSIDFKERIERRRGDRRRGYRRIDERSLVSRAQQEAHLIKELAAREGYKNGLEKAQKEIDEIKKSLIEFLSMRDEMYEEFYPHILELSLEAAKKIIKKEVEMSPDILKSIIESVLDEISLDAQKIEIKVNPDDFSFAQISLPEIIQAKRTHAKVLIGQDQTIEKGSCIVIANNGVIDANFRTQLTVLQNSFGIYKGGL